VNRNGEPRYVPTSITRLCTFDFVRIENQQPVYQFKTQKERTPWLVDNINSKWQGQISELFF
jgi:hypothetical protein